MEDKAEDFVAPQLVQKIQALLPAAEHAAFLRWVSHRNAEKSLDFFALEIFASPLGWTTHNLSFKKWKEVLLGGGGQSYRTAVLRMDSCLETATFWNRFHQAVWLEDGATVALSAGSKFLRMERAAWVRCFPWCMDLPYPLHQKTWNAWLAQRPLTANPTLHDVLYLKEKVLHRLYPGYRPRRAGAEASLGMFTFIMEEHVGWTAQDLYGLDRWKEVGTRCDLPFATAVHAMAVSSGETFMDRLCEAVPLNRTKVFFARSRDHSRVEIRSFREALPGLQDLPYPLNAGWNAHLEARSNSTAVPTALERETIRPECLRALFPEMAREGMHPSETTSLQVFEDLFLGQPRWVSKNLAESEEPKADAARRAEALSKASGSSFLDRLETSGIFTRFTLTTGLGPTRYLFTNAASLGRSFGKLRRLPYPLTPETLAQEFAHTQPVPFPDSPVASEKSVFKPEVLSLFYPTFSARFRRVEESLRFYEALFVPPVEYTEKLYPSLQAWKDAGEDTRISFDSTVTCLVLRWNDAEGGFSWFLDQLFFPASLCPWAKELPFPLDEESWTAFLQTRDLNTLPTPLCLQTLQPDRLRQLYPVVDKQQREAQEETEFAARLATRPTSNLCHFMESYLHARKTSSQI